MRSILRRLMLPIVVLALSGCASTSPKAAALDTSQLVKERSGEQVSWLEAGGEEQAAKEASRLLASELTLGGAVRVSLLSNRRIQAAYEELGVAQADLVQAGLLKNPSVGATYDFRLDQRANTSDAFAFSVVTDLMQLFTMGSRKRVARAALEGTKYRVASEILKHVYDVRVGYLAVQAAQQTFTMRQIVNDAAEAAVAVARRQHEAGTINDLDLANEEALFGQVSMDLARSSADVTSAREHLNRLMGVWGTNTQWRVTAPLAELPNSEPSLDHLESKAVAARYDLAAAHRDVEVVSYALSLAKNTRWTGSIDAGVDFHREVEGVRLVGPTMSVQVPIFDQGQATIARIESQLRQAKSREAALAIDIRSEVRELAARLRASRAVVENYQRTLVPMREKIVALSQQQYDAMLLGVFQLLIAKQNETNSYREFIEALRDYWVLRSELEWKVGGNMGSSVATSPSKTISTSPKASENQPADHGSSHEHHAP